ncbi:MAG: GAF domain-containing protein [Terriglobales bacterium]
MPGTPQSDDQGSDTPLLSVHPGAIPAARPHSEPSDDLPDRAHLAANLSANLEEHELESALQLLVERAQYITGATGAALALPQGDEMVCRASAGACAPTVGARLQVRSGLTGESIARRQLLRCDNAETDPRVNLETCRALGIASIVVLPLLRRTGEVRALFELFSDHPYAFEERDLVALERMAALTITALDLAEQQHDSVTFAPPRQSRPAETRSVPTASTAPQAKELPRPLSPPPQPSLRVDEQLASASPARTVPDNSTPPISSPVIASPLTAAPVIAAPVIPPPTVGQPSVTPPIVYQPIVSEPTTESDPLQPVPEAMRRVQKCATCGFPVSEGRTFCLDCENLERLKIESDKKARQTASTEIRTANPDAIPTNTKPTGQEILEPTTEAAQTTSPTEANPTETEAGNNLSADLFNHSPEEILPPFLTNPQLVEESWLARHVNLLAFLVLVAAVLVAAVVFFR